MHISNDKIDNREYIQPIGIKPVGLWYSIGLGWLDYVINNFTEFYSNKDLFVYKLDISKLNILKISNLSELEIFSDTYSNDGFIDFDLVQKKLRWY